MSARPMHLEAPPGLRRVVVPTAAGMVTVHVGHESEGDVATVLLHGAAGSWTTWAPLLADSAATGHPALRNGAAALSNIVAIDLPGWGASPGPVPPPARLACVVADVVRALGYRRWGLIGHSLGGAVALEVAGRFPAQTVAVGLVSPSGAAVRDVAGHPLRKSLRLPSFAGMRAAMSLLAALGRGAGPLLRMLRATGVLRVLAAPLFRSRVDRSVTDALADEIRPRSFLAAAATAGEVDVSLWRRIRVPVRSVRGRHDAFARADDDTFFARHVPDFATLVLADAGHFAHIERPARTLEGLGDVVHAIRSANDAASAAIRSGGHSESDNGGRARA